MAERGGDLLAEFVLHGLAPSLLRHLSDLASKSGRSVEHEAKRKLEESFGVARKRAVEAARRIRESHGRTFGDSTGLIREDRDR